MGPTGRLGAVVAAYLLVTATVAPLVSIGMVEAAGNEPVVAGNSPQSLKAQAVDDTRELTATKKRFEAARERAADRLNDSRQHYRGPVRASSAKLFDHDAKGMQALTAFSGTDTESDATAVAEAVLRMDNRTAYREVADARRLLNDSRDAIDNEGIVRSMEAHLDNAERTYDRAEDTMSRARGAEGKRALRLRASSVRQLRQTWRQAHFVVERAVERTNATLPVGTIDDGNESDAGDGNESDERLDGNVSATVLSRNDPIRNRSDPGNYTVGVNVSADGPVSLETLVAAVDGERVAERNLSGLAVTENRTLPVGVSVPLDAGGNRVRVTVTGNDGATAANATLRLDGDGLNATYETDVLGTDPLDPDSDSSATDADEADDGTIDGRADFDDDSLGTLTERDIGTDPLDADTDGDGLTDREEFLTETDPLVADTDDDGTVDGEEDPDGDGLTHAEEVAEGSAPLFADGDADGVPDPAELENGTDPLDPDSDGDGLTDGEEPTAPFETDPLDADTDGDGVDDGNETYTTRVENETVGVSLSVTGEGNVASGVTVEETPSPLGNDSVSAGPTVHVENRTSFETATLTLAVAESRDPSEYDDLAVYKWDGTRGGDWHDVGATFDPANGTATVTTDSFSYYTVIDVDSWRSARRVDGVAPVDLDDEQAAGRLSCSGVCTVTNATATLGGEPDAREIVVTQGDREFSVVPLSNGQSIHEFYNYGSAQLNSPLPVAASDTSRLFFWGGPNGLSLVTVHDLPNDGSGGAASLDISGLPTAEGRWVVRDDQLPAKDDYSDDGMDPDWTWNGQNTDGGAYRGGLVNSTFTVASAFGSAARLEPLTTGEITDWQFLTGQATDPRNVSLDMDEPITIEVPDALDNETGADRPTNGSLEWSYDVPSSVGDRGLDLTYQTEQTGIDPNATVIVSGYEQAPDPQNRRQITERYDLTLGTVGTVRQYVPLDAFQPGTEVTVRAVSANVSTRLQVTTRTDTDGDGLWNGWENKTYTYEHLLATDSGRTTGRIQPTETFDTSWQDPDTDDDGVLDSQEYSVQRLPANETHETARLVANSTTHPTDPDTDGDGALDDEFRGWNITVVETANGDPFRYYNRSKSDPPENGRTIDTIHVSSEPLDRDTDGDGLVDGVEKSTTFTDPRAEVTYELTEQHQDLIDRLETDGRAGVAIGAHIVDDREQLSSLELTDRTDDFDFVRPTFGQDLARVDFHALDSVVRTDTWLSNEEEVDKSVVFNGSVNPWDPDSDDDGLTDGQEVYGVTKAVSADLVEMDDSVSYETDPTDPDTDGDGYWDGWIGVYNVSYDYTENLILYREHLQSGGISGDEVINEQVGVHHMDEVASTVGADIDRTDDRKEHSNIHIGELQWGSTPDDVDDVPDTEISVEIDFTTGAQESFNSSSWETAVEENFGLFGIDVDLRRDETVAEPEHDLSTDLYTLVGSDPSALLPTGFLTDEAQEKSKVRLRGISSERSRTIRFRSQASQKIRSSFQSQTFGTTPAMSRRVTANSHRTPSRSRLQADSR